MTKNNTTEELIRHFHETFPSDLYMWDGKKECHVNIDVKIEEKLRELLLQERKDTLERCLELLPKEKMFRFNEHPSLPKEDIYSWNSCRFQAESAIKEEIKKV